jgi:hypothetical protein
MQSHIITDSTGNHYLRQLVKKIRIPSLKPGVPDEIIPRYTTRRWDPATQSPIPRIRTSKKLRLKLKRLLCSAVSSNSTSAPALSTSPA